MTKIGQILEARRKELGANKTQMAHALGLNSQNYSTAIHHEDHKFTRTAIRRAAVMGIDPRLMVEPSRYDETIVRAHVNL